MKVSHKKDFTGKIITKLSDLVDVKFIDISGDRVKINAYDSNWEEIKPEVIDSEVAESKIDKLSKVLESKNEEYGRNVEESVQQIKRLADTVWADFEEGKFETAIILVDNIKLQADKLIREIKSYE
jgi:hypothetical protein